MQGALLMVAEPAVAPPPLPAQPTGASLTALSGTQVRLDWTDNATDEISYEVQISTDVGFNPGVTTHIQGLAVNLATYTFTGLVAGTEYFARARAVNHTGNGAWSATASGYTLGTPPSQPDSCGAFATGTNTIRQVWTDVGDEDHFELAWSGVSDFSSGVSTTTVASGVVHYDWTTIPTGNVYVRVRGVSTTLGSSLWRGYSNNSASGDYASAFGFVKVPTSLASPPSAPSAVTVTINSATSVTLNWTEGSGGGFGRTEIQVARDASYEDTAQLKDDDVSAQTKTFTGLDPNTTYYYRLRSQDNTAGDFSSWVTGSFLTAPSAVPAAPTGHAVTTTAATTLDFGWTDTPNAQISQVEADIAEDAGFSVGLQSDAAVGVGTEAKQWTGLTEGTEYHHRVRCVNPVGNGAYSTITAFTQLAAPTSLVAGDNGTFWTLTWTRNSTNNTAVEYYKDTGSGFVLFDTSLIAAPTGYSVAKEAGASWKIRHISTSGAPASEYSNIFTDPTP